MLLRHPRSTRRPPPCCFRPRVSGERAGYREVGQGSARGQHAIDETAGQGTREDEDDVPTNSRRLKGLAGRVVAAAAAAAAAV